MVGSTQNQSPYHQCSDKSHQTHGRHVFCCGQNPPHILTHRGPIGEGGQICSTLATFSICAQICQHASVHIGRSPHDRHRPIWSPGGGGGRRYHGGGGVLTSIKERTGVRSAILGRPQTKVRTGDMISL